MLPQVVPFLPLETDEKQDLRILRQWLAADTWDSNNGSENNVASLGPSEVHRCPFFEINAVFPKSLIAFGKVQFNKHDRNVSRMDFDLPHPRVWLGSLIPVCSRCCPAFGLWRWRSASLKEARSLSAKRGGRPRHGQVQFRRDIL